jgi:hypothetical protein
VNAATYKPAVAARLPHHSGAVDYNRMPRGSWQRSGKPSRLWIRCGDCGTLLSCSHAVAAAGKVTPSVGCPVCGWHVWATLERVRLREQLREETR